MKTRWLYSAIATGLLGVSMIYNFGIKSFKKESLKKAAGFVREKAFLSADIAYCSLEDIISDIELPLLNKMPIEGNILFPGQKFEDLSINMNKLIWSIGTDYDPSKIEYIINPLKIDINAKIDYYKEEEDRWRLLRQKILKTSRDPAFEKVDSLYEMIALSIHESDHYRYARGKKGELGNVQYMAVTAREDGLIVNSKVDERTNPAKALPAAEKRLLRLEEYFGANYLALGAWNWGPKNIADLIDYCGGRKDWSALKNRFPIKTKNLILDVLAIENIAREVLNNKEESLFANNKPALHRAKSKTDYTAKSALDSGDYINYIMEHSRGKNLIMIALETKKDLDKIISSNPDTNPGEYLKKGTKVKIPVR